MKLVDILIHASFEVMAQLRNLLQVLILDVHVANSFQCTLPHFTSFAQV